MSATATTPIESATPDEIFAPWVEWTEEICRRGRRLVVAVNHREGQAIHLDPAELAPSHHRNSRLMADLHDGGFLRDDNENAPRPPLLVRQPGDGIVWQSVDRFVRICHDRGMRHLFRPVGVAAQIVVATGGLFAVARTVRDDGLQLHAHPAEIPFIVAIGLVAVLVHELGHALVTVHYGRHVRIAGLRLHLGSPAFFVDSLDALLLTRRQRLLQAAAGPWAEWLVTGATAFIFLALDPGTAAATILHRFVVINTIVIATNLLPFVGLDGALLFADVIREPDLPLRMRSSRCRNAPERWLRIYLVLNSCIASGLLVMAGFFWWQLFGDLTTTLWRFGSAGIAASLVLVALILRQSARIIAPALADITPDVDRLRSNVAFRLERRWRVDAIKAFRSLPDLADLDARALGALAGQLDRITATCANTNSRTGYIYIPKTRRARRAVNGVAGPGTVIAIDSGYDLTRYVDAVFLPDACLQVEAIRNR